jgi:hypothetical protein
LGCVSEWNNKKYLNYVDKIHNNISKEQLGIFLPREKDIINFNSQNNFSILITGIDTLIMIESLKKIYQLNEKN